MDIYQQLARPFPVNRIHWRLGATNGDKTSGIGLAYIDARDVMQRLDEVMGPANWQARYSHADKIVVCDLGLFIRPALDAEDHKDASVRFSSSPEWVWKANGAGETQVEGEKGSCSDAFKRAAVLWGIGRYLYALPNVWAPIKSRGRSHYLPDESIELLNKRLPQWAIPEIYDEIMAKRKSA